MTTTGADSNPNSKVTGDNPVAEHTSEPGNNASTNASTDPMIKGRYVLHHCLSTTSLMALYWAHDDDIEESDTFSDDSDRNLLLAIINPTVAQLRSFENTLRTNWAYFATPKPGQPHVVDYGKEPGGQLWFAMRDTNGLLLSERLQELDDRSLPADTANRIAHAIQQTAQGLQDKPYGFLEPGIIQKSGNDTYKLLNAPIVRTLQHLLTTKQEQKLALHSPYLSPSVAVGDLPTTEDDSFAIAAIFYELLTHQPPFAKRSSLEAAVHGDAPHTVKKLNETQWQVLKSALAFQRSQRPATPGALLKQLNDKKRSKILYPVAAFVALGIATFAAYHLVSKVDEALPDSFRADNSAMPNATPVDTTPAPTANTATATETITAEVPPPATNEATNIASETETALTPQDTLTPPATNATETNETEAELTALLEKAQQAINDNQLIHEDSSKNTATRYLQQLLAKSPDHQGAQSLLTELISEQHKQVSNALEAKEFTQAEQQLDTTDAIISAFALADFLIPQARLEATVESQLHKQTMIAQYLERAKTAIKRDKLSSGDEEGEGAINYLQALMLEVPDHPEGKRLLKDIVNRQHQQARKLIRKKELEEARDVLDSSQRIIGRYRFDELAEKQLQLEDGYRDRQLGNNTLPAASNIERERPASTPTPAAPTPRAAENRRAATPTRNTTNNPRLREREQPARTVARPAPATPSADTNGDGLLLLPMPEPQVSFEATAPETPVAAPTSAVMPRVTPPITPPITPPAVTPASASPSPTPQEVAPATALEGLPSVLPDDAFDYALPAIANPAPAPQPAPTPVNITTPSPVVSYEVIESTNNVQIPNPASNEPIIPEVPLSIISDGLPVLPLPPNNAAQ